MLRIPESARAETRASLERVAQMTDSLFVNRALAQEAGKAGVLQDPLVTLRGQQVLEAYQARVYLDHLERAQKFPNLEARARELYLADRAKYVLPETFEVEHILVGLWGRTREMAIARVEEARSKVAGGAEFLAVAKEYTTDPGFRQNGGKLGTVPAKELDAAIGQVLPTLRIGEVSKPIESRSGFHIVRVMSKNPGRQLSFDEVKEAIIEDERGKATKRMTEEKLQSYRADAKTRIDTDAMKRLVQDIPREEIQRLQQRPAAEPRK